jgi:hypothetical protein
MKRIQLLGRIASAALIIPCAYPIEQALASDCNWRKAEWGSYCLIPRTEGGSKIIEIILKSSREGTTVMTYRGKSFAKGAVFIDDEYNGRHILKHFGKDRVILQDTNGNPPDVYLR